MFVLDSHCDTPSQILRLRDVGLDNARGHVDFPKMRRGGVDGAFFALYTPASLAPEQATSKAFELLALLNRLLQRLLNCLQACMMPWMKTGTVRLLP